MQFPPPLDPSYLPIIEFERQYLAKAKAQTQTKAEGMQRCVLALVKNPQQVAHQETQISLASELKVETLTYLQRLIKSMLWIYGGYRLHINLPSNWINELQQIFAGPQKFDSEFIVEGIFERKLEICHSEASEVPSEATESSSIGGKSGGRRLGFDVGGSDKKIAAIDGSKVLFTESIIWDPYPQSDLNWHKKEMQALYELGASKLPGPVQAIGGSVPGIVMDNEIKVSSLFRGLQDPAQRSESRHLFQDVARQLFGPIPYRLANDGDVTALAGAMLLNKYNLLGIAMGTSEAAGYANAAGAVNSWFSELAFVPVDMGPERSQDEWSKDWGTGVEYFSQQAVLRLAAKAGLELPEQLSKPQKLALVQEKLAAEGGEEGNSPVADIFCSIGRYLGYALPWYHRFYRMSNVLLLGRVLKGQGGKWIIREAERVLAAEFPELGLSLFTLSDEEILHGQAMAAASLA